MSSFFSSFGSWFDQRIFVTSLVALVNKLLPFGTAKLKCLCHLTLAERLAPVKICKD